MGDTYMHSGIGTKALLMGAVGGGMDFLEAFTATDFCHKIRRKINR